MLILAKRKLWRPRGIVRLYENGRLLSETENLWVNSGLVALANLLANVTSGNVAKAVGFGSGLTTPAVTDTDLTGPWKYYNAVGAATVGPSGGIASGSVQFAYALAATDYGASGMTINELGLFGGTATLPAAIGTTNPAWQATHAYVVGNLIVDSNNNIQRCTTAGTSGGSAPAWATTLSSTTSDSGAVWTLVALHTAPVGMIAHDIVPAFPFTVGNTYSGTWTFSM
jgi:hypothetical protein